MMRIEQLQIEIEALPPQEFKRLRQWFMQKDWERWDQQRFDSRLSSAGQSDSLFTEWNKTPVMMFWVR